MAKCFWYGKCDCPSRTPQQADCTQHGGRGCGILDGVVVRRLAQIQDANTRILEAAFTAVRRDRATIAAVRTSIAQIDADVEAKQRELRTLELRAGSANFQKRRAIVRRVRQIHVDTRNWVTLIQADQGKLERTVSNNMSVVHTGVGLLLRPFLDSDFCECSSIKKKVLDSLSRRLDVHLRRLESYKREHAALSTRIKGMLGLVYGSIVVWGAAWAAAVAVATTIAIIVGVLAFCIAVAAIITAVARMQVLAEDIRRTKAWILRLTLVYYRVQKIPVCTPADVAATPLLDRELTMVDDLEEPPPRPEDDRPAPPTTPTEPLEPDE